MNALSFPSTDTPDCVDSKDVSSNSYKVDKKQRVCSAYYPSTISQRCNQTTDSSCSSVSRNDNHNQINCGYYHHWTSQHTTEEELSSSAIDKSTHSVDEETRMRRRKPYVMKKAREIWTAEEHQRFVEALHLYHRDWKQIERHVGTKNVLQIRSHAQKYFYKVQKYQTGEYVPPPRPKRKYSHTIRQGEEESESNYASSSNNKFNNSSALPQAPGPPNNFSNNFSTMHNNNNNNEDTSHPIMAHQNAFPIHPSAVHGYPPPCALFPTPMNYSVQSQQMSYSKQYHWMKEETSKWNTANPQNVYPTAAWIQTTGGWCLVPVYPVINNNNAMNSPYYSSFGIADIYQQQLCMDKELKSYPKPSSLYSHCAFTTPTTEPFHAKVGDEQISIPPNDNREKPKDNDNTSPHTNQSDEPCSDVEVSLQPCRSQNSSDPRSDSSSPQFCGDKCEILPNSQNGTQMSHLVSVALQDWVEWSQE